MKQNHHPDTAHFVSLIVDDVQRGITNLLVIGRDKRDLGRLKSLIRAMMDLLDWEPRIETANLIGIGATSIQFRVQHDIYRHDLDGVSVFCSPLLVDAGLPPELEEALTGVESQLAPL
jgi:hypothetical protein